MAGQLTVQGASVGEPGGERIFNFPTIVGKAVIGETIVTPMTLGTNTFSVPLESVAVVIQPPQSNEVALRFRTSLNAPDGGLPLYESYWPFVYPFPVAIPTTITITAAGPTTSGVSITFI